MAFRHLEWCFLRLVKRGVEVGFRYTNAYVVLRLDLWLRPGRVEVKPELLLSSINREHVDKVKWSWPGRDSEYWPLEKSRLFRQPDTPVKC